MALRINKPTLHSIKQKTIKLGIGIPLNFPMIPSAFFDSFIIMDKPDFVYIRSSNGYIDDMRNEVVRDAQKADCTHLIMMDTDQVYDPKTITKLLSHDLPIVGCLVYRRYPPFDPLMLKGSISKYKTIKEWEPNSLVEVDATGGGCLLFNMQVFQYMPYPWFKFRERDDSDIVSEDIGFCHDLRENGYKIFVDTSIDTGHLSQMIINGGTWKLYNRVKEAELKAMHQIEHGISTVKI
jgi:hypothetical protein